MASEAPGRIVRAATSWNPAQRGAPTSGSRWPASSAIAIWAIATLPVLCYLHLTYLGALTPLVWVGQANLVISGALALALSVVDPKRTLAWIGASALTWAAWTGDASIGLLYGGGLLAAGTHLGVLVPGGEPGSAADDDGGRRSWRTRFGLCMVLLALVALSSMQGQVKPLSVPSLAMLGALAGLAALAQRHPRTLGFALVLLIVVQVAPADAIAVPWLLLPGILVVGQFGSRRPPWSPWVAPFVISTLISWALLDVRTATMAIALLTTALAITTTVVRPRWPEGPTWGGTLDACERRVQGLARWVLMRIRRWYRWTPWDEAHGPARGSATDAEGRWRWLAGAAAAWAAAMALAWRVNQVVGVTTDQWSQWDSFIFLDIAEQGPSWPIDGRPTVTSFPLFGLIMRALGPHVGGPLAAATLTSSIAGLLALALFSLWLHRMGVGRRAAALAVASLAASPWGFFLFGIAYADGLFLALALACFVLLEQERPILAGLAGALATATRPTGLALLAAVVILQLERAGALDRLRPLPRLWVRAPVERARSWWRSTCERQPLQSLRPAHLGVLLTGGGIGAYSIYCWIEFGDPVAFWSAQRWYGHGAALDPWTWSKSLFIGSVTQGSWGWGEIVNTSAQASLTVAAAASIPAVSRRFGIGYGVYLGFLVVQSWIGDTTFSVSGRYLIAAFPLFALWGSVLAKRPRWMVALVLVASLVLSLYLRSQFIQSRGFPIW